MGRKDIQHNCMCVKYLKNTLSSHSLLRSYLTPSSGHQPLIENNWTGLVLNHKK